MNRLFSFIPKKTFIIILGLIIIVISLSLVLFIRQPKTTTPPLPVISQSPTFLSPLQKTIIGKTTTSDLDQAYQIKDKQVLANGALQYSIDSEIEARPNQVVFHNNLAQFERIVIVGNVLASGNIKLSDQILKYGLVERVIRGSKFYGNHMDTYIYASNGFAFIANTNADEVYEIQIFPPTSLDNYLSTYGEDIDENKEIEGEI